jgi:hypothetical protein
VALAVTESLRQDIVDRLRAMAARRETVDEMVEYVQRELGFSKEFIVPVLPFFCRAFDLPLKEVLPLREWVANRSNEDATTLLSRIKEFGERTGDVAG